jgi:bifunctional non-homologous end joining protein LigD
LIDRRRPEGIFINSFERGEIGPDLFRAACQMGLEGLVSKRRDRPYQAGRSKHWIKVKNRKHPAMSRGAWMISNFLSNLLIAVGVGAGAVEPFKGSV